MAVRFNISYFFMTLTNKEELVRSMKIKGSLRCSDHKMVDFKTLKAASRVHSNSLPWTAGEQTLAFSGICLVDYHGINPWREKGPRKLVSIHLLPAQKRCMPRKGKSGKSSRKPTWMTHWRQEMPSRGTSTLL